VTREFHDGVLRRPVPLPRAFKDRLREVPLAERSWTRYRRAQLHREYEQRREYYHEQAQQRCLVYREAEMARQALARLAARGYSPRVAPPGEVHTFACVPQYGWHHHLLPDLRELGPVTLFDYTALGYRYHEFTSGTRAAHERRNTMFAALEAAVRRAHAQRPIDWVFCYGGGQDTSPVLIRRLTEELGMPAVNMSLDDKQGWAGRRVGAWRSGARDLTSAFDLFITSARVACEWHMVEGGRPVYLPEGFDANAFRPGDAEPDIDVSFVGAAYGFRRDVAAYLARHGVPVRTFGAGWRGGGWAPDLAALFNRTRINLGMGGIEYSEALTNLKGRDFEVPGTGGGAYLTSYNPDLALHFEVGAEVLCYRNRDELLELIRYYLARPDEAAAIARRGRERCLREHRWLHRYQRVLGMLGVLQASPRLVGEAAEVAP